MEDHRPITRERWSDSRAVVGHLVSVAVADGIATITLDSPANRNALSQQLLADLHSALDEAEAADARVVVLDARATGVLCRCRPQGTLDRCCRFDVVRARDRATGSDRGTGDRCRRRARARRRYRADGGM